MIIQVPWGCNRPKKRRKWEDEVRRSALNSRRRVQCPSQVATTSLVRVGTPEYNDNALMRCSTMGQGRVWWWWLGRLLATRWSRVRPAQLKNPHRGINKFGIGRRHHFETNLGSVNLTFSSGLDPFIIDIDNARTGCGPAINVVALWRPMRLQASCWMPWNRCQ